MVYQHLSSLRHPFRVYNFPTHNSLTNQLFLRLWNNLIECEKLERDLASEGHNNAARREPDTSAENAQGEVTM